MFTAAVFFSVGYGTAYFLNRFGPALTVWKKRVEKDIEETLRND